MSKVAGPFNPHSAFLLFASYVLTQIQTILRIANIDVLLIPSSNHASPSGALPFLMPASTSQSTPQAPVSGAKITRFIRETNPRAPIDLDNPSSKIDAYQALLANNIRPAWVRVHQFFLLYNRKKKKKKG